MASAGFQQLEAEVQDLKRVYLQAALDDAGAPPPNLQEAARAFVVFAHAEVEWYVERAALALAEEILNAAKAGHINASSLSLLTFSSLDPMVGGDKITRKGQGASRSLTTRLGDAAAKLRQLAQDNEGIREKHLAKMLIPLGLSQNNVDPAWVADIETLASWRGAFAHISRREQRANHLSVNPTDVWTLCKRMIWRSAALPAGQVASFEELDDWIETSKASFGLNHAVQGTLMQRVQNALAILWRE